jgi:hypothetical protein
VETEASTGRSQVVKVALPRAMQLSAAPQLSIAEPIDPNVHVYLTLYFRSALGLSSGTIGALGAMSETKPQ